MAKYYKITLLTKEDPTIYNSVAKYKNQAETTLVVSSLSDLFSQIKSEARKRGLIKNIFVAADALTEDGVVPLKVDGEPIWKLTHCSTLFG